ncbi:MAG: hypothetical protein HYT93_04035 [Parcubacteria group bacterium]|nr:hypothetical protein [Parcubacteria group bacterium]
MNEVLKQESEQGRWDALADTIEKLDPPQHGGPWETVTQSITKALRRGDIAYARACCRNESDKFGDPKREKVKKLLIEELFEGKDHPWGKIM